MPDICDDADKLIELANDLGVAASRKALSADPVNHKGECSDCGCPIDPRRLEVKPNARRCIPCQTRFERGF